MQGLSWAHPQTGKLVPASDERSCVLAAFMRSGKVIFDSRTQVQASIFYASLLDQAPECTLSLKHMGAALSPWGVQATHTNCGTFFHGCGICAQRAVVLTPPKPKRMRAEPFAPRTIGDLIAFCEARSQQAKSPCSCGSCDFCRKFFCNINRADDPTSVGVQKCSAVVVAHLHAAPPGRARFACCRGLLQLLLVLRAFNTRWSIILVCCCCCCCYTKLGKQDKYFVSPPRPPPP